MTAFTPQKPDLAERSTRDDDQVITTSRPRRRGLLAVVALVALGAAAAGWEWQQGTSQTSPLPPPPPPQVTVSTPLQEIASTTNGFLGQFSAVDAVDLRAQVGGTLTQIAFRDGQIVHKGDLLFVIDPRPFQIKLDQAIAQLQTAEAKKSLAEVELWRAQQLKRTSFGTAEAVDQRVADDHAAQAAVEAAKAAIRDAQLDLEYARVVAPFTGRIGAHLISVGGIVSGSRGTTSGTTLLTTIVSLDPIHLDFDMSEADYLAFRKGHPGANPDTRIAVSLDGEGHYDRSGTLDFIDNAVNRGSGTIHARATIPNPDLTITPGQFARLRVPLGHPGPVLLVPASAVVPDQSRQIVMTVAPDNTVVPKPVEIGDLVQGLRIIRAGLAPTDRIIIDGLVRARPGAPVNPTPGTITPVAGGDNS